MAHTTRRRFICIIINTLLLWHFSTAFAQEASRVDPVSWQEVSDFALDIMKHAHRALPEQLPIDFIDNQVTSGYLLPFHLDDDELNKSGRAPKTATFNFEPKPDELDFEKTVVRLEGRSFNEYVGSLDEEEREAFFAKLENFGRRIEQFIGERIHDQHFVHVPEDKKIIVVYFNDPESAEKREVWFYPEGTEIYHLMFFNAPVKLLTRGGDGFDFYTQAQNSEAGLDFELRVLRKTNLIHPGFDLRSTSVAAALEKLKLPADSAWAVGTYRPNRDMTTWEIAKDLDTAQPTGRGERPHYRPFSFQLEDDPYKMEGSEFPTNPVDCLSCHMEKSRSKYQFPTVRIAGLQEPQPSMATRHGQTLFAGPSAFAPANSAIRSDPKLAGLFELRSSQPQAEGQIEEDLLVLGRVFAPYVYTIEAEAILQHHIDQEMRVAHRWFRENGLDHHTPMIEVIVAALREAQDDLPIPQIARIKAYLINGNLRISLDVPKDTFPPSTLQKNVFTKIPQGIGPRATAIEHSFAGLNDISVFVHAGLYRSEQNASGSYENSDIHVLAVDIVKE